jgi:hypothetical protein
MVSMSKYIILYAQKKKNINFLVSENFEVIQWISSYNWYKKKARIHSNIVQVKGAKILTMSLITPSSDAGGQTNSDGL